MAASSADRTKQCVTDIKMWMSASGAYFDGGRIPGWVGCGCAWCRETPAAVVARAAAELLPPRAPAKFVISGMAPGTSVVDQTIMKLRWEAVQLAKQSADKCRHALRLAGDGERKGGSTVMLDLLQAVGEEFHRAAADTIEYHEWHADYYAPLVVGALGVSIGTDAMRRAVTEAASRAIKQAADDAAADAAAMENAADVSAALERVGAAVPPPADTVGALLAAHDVAVAARAAAEEPAAVELSAPAVDAFDALQLEIDLAPSPAPPPRSAKVLDGEETEPESDIASVAAKADAGDRGTNLAAAGAAIAIGGGHAAAVFFGAPAAPTAPLPIAEPPTLGDCGLTAKGRLTRQRQPTLEAAVAPGAPPAPAPKRVKFDADPDVIVVEDSDDE